MEEAGEVRVGSQHHAQGQHGGGGGGGHQEDPSPTLFVPHLPADCGEKDLDDLFGSCAGYSSSRLRTDKHGSVVGFIEFRSTHDARQALDQVNGKELRGSIISPHFARGNRKRPRNDESNLEGYPRGHNSGAMVYGRGIGSFGAGMGGPPIAPGLPLSLPHDASPTLYIDGFSEEISEREMSHIFRPFPGFHSLRIRHKESQRIGGAKRAMCFVEFDNVHQAALARAACANYVMEMDPRRGEQGVLTIHFSKASRRNH